jgi:hypothetical protein
MMLSYDPVGLVEVDEGDFFFFAAKYLTRAAGIGTREYPNPSAHCSKSFL